MLKFLFSSVFLLLFASSAHAGWSGWAPLGGQITSDPAACTAGNMTVVFAKGTDNKIWYRTRNLPTGIWAQWKMLPETNLPNKTFSGAPSATCRLYGYGGQVLYTQVFVSVIGSDARFYNIAGWVTPTQDGWSNWWAEPASPALNSAPALAWKGDRQHTFIKGADNRMYIRTGPAGNPWFLMTVENVIGDPAAVVSADDRLDFFYRDRYGELYQRVMQGTTWYPRKLVEGVIYSSPEVISRDRNSLDLFAKGPQNTVMHKRSVDGVWGPWINLSGAVTSAPGATTYANNTRMFVFVRWSDGSLRYKAWAP